MLNEKSYHVIGIMSGSSLDGLDIAYCEMQIGEKNTFEIVAAQTINYTHKLKSFLQKIIPDIHQQYINENDFFSRFVADAIMQFKSIHKLNKVDCIALHGHTVFHYPAQGKTCQLGNGQLIADLTGDITIFNFRQADIDAGGQGAPLVPLCDELFFNNYAACLNIGGIANISYATPAGRTGFDICGANQLLNYLANTVGLEYDEDGELAAAGNVDENLLLDLNGSPFFTQLPPKSLDNHYIRKYFIERLASSTIPTNDKLATATFHIAQQIAAVILGQKQHATAKYNLLVTGGGAFNKTLINQIEMLADVQLEKVSAQLVQYKESLAMCLMGVRRLRNESNFLPSVTGARIAVSGGQIALPSIIKQVNQ